MASEGVQMLIPGGLDADGLRAERRRVFRQLGIAKMEREGRCVLVGRRLVKAWRVAGEPEFNEHARKVALMAGIFSGSE